MAVRTFTSAYRDRLDIEEVFCDHIDMAGLERRNIGVIPSLEDKITALTRVVARACKHLDDEQIVEILEYNYHPVKDEDNGN